MKAIIFSKKEDAKDFEAQMNTLLGYPKTGVHAGSGIHVPLEQSKTIEHQTSVESSKDGGWVYIVDAQVRANLPAKYVESDIAEALEAK